METLYAHLSARVPRHICGWLPETVNRRGLLPATPRRVAWAVREIARQGTYPAACAVEALRGTPSEAHLRESAASVAQVMRHR